MGTDTPGLQVHLTRDESRMAWLAIDHLAASLARGDRGDSPYFAERARLARALADAWHDRITIDISRAP